MSSKRPFKYTNFCRDILFDGIQPSTKDKNKRDFLDCCKCLVWEENRTRYELDEKFKAKIDLSRVYSNTLNQEGALDKWLDLSPDLTAELDFYRSEFPYNVKYFPQYPYLKYKYSTRSKWYYDPTEGGKKFARKMLFSGLIGTNQDEDHTVQKFEVINGEKKLVLAKSGGKIISRTVPITLHIDPLVDPKISKQVIIDNFDGVMDMAQMKKIEMEKDGFVFMSKKQIPESRKAERETAEFHIGIYSPFDPIHKSKKLNQYNSAMQFLGLYRLLECKGLKWHELESKYYNHFGHMGEVPMSFEHYKKKVKSVLRLFPHSKL
jgi:hypothetical protein